MSITDINFATKRPHHCKSTALDLSKKKKNTKKKLTRSSLMTVTHNNNHKKFKLKKTCFVNFLPII